MNLKKAIISGLKVALPIGLGIYLVIYVYNSLSATEKTELFESFGRANYFWVAISLIFAVLSHVSRAYRWKYLLEPLGHSPSFINSFYTVMIGYIANLVFPRIGEITRCGMMSKYEKIPFNQLFGTVVAERVFDMLILLSITAGVVLFQLDTLGGLLSDFMNSGKDSDNGSLALIILLSGFIIALAVFGVIWKSNHVFAVKVKGIILGFWDGIKTVLVMKNKLLFFAHTLFIWIMYILMFYIVLLSLPETSDISIIAILAAFIMGGLSIVFVQGGIGVYPLAIMQTLMLYGVAKTSGLAMGWIIWTTQTIMIIIVGAFSLIMLPIHNKKKNG